MQAFQNQVQEFCLMMHEEVLERWDNLPETPASRSNALEFTEKFLLCPTLESARCCIHKDFPGALSFALALEGVNQRLQNGLLQLPTEWPEHQTKFYVLSCAVQEYFESMPTATEPPAGSETVAAA